MRTFAALLFLLAVSLSAQDVKLPYKLVTLDNGLQLVMQPDPSMPTVGVEYWIRGGSREEVPGLFGIAHLFEHNVPSSGRFSSNAENRALRARTGRGSGAGTQPDFLRFYLYTTAEGVEATLAQLADRLESDYAKFTAESVARDQDIVLSELRRSLNVDWDLEVMNHLHRGTFGADHPYGHATSGNEADVKNATVETMRDWHRRFAGASNAILFVVGNFAPAKVEAMVRKHYGPIPPGTRAPRPTEAVPPAHARRDVLEKDVPKPVVYLRWPVPGWGTADGDYLTLLAQILTRSMYDATASVELFELAGSFGLRGEDEAPMRAALAKVLRDGVTEDDVARAKLVQQTDFVRLLQRGVWRYSRADAIGFGLMFRNDPDAYREQLARIANATPTQINDAARRWLASPGYTLQVVPRPKRAATGTIDRAATVPPGEAMKVEFLKVEMTTLPSGLRVILARRDALPLAQITVAYPHGTDVKRLARDLTVSLAARGAEVTAGQDVYYSTLSVSVLSAKVDDVLKLLAKQRLTLDVTPATFDPMTLRETVLGAISGRQSAAVINHDGAEVLVLSGDLREIPPAAHELAVHKTPRTTPPLKSPESERFVIVDHPTAAQAHILLAQVLPSNVARDPLAADLVVHSLRSRLMNNLRTAKGWSYEVYPFGVELHRGSALARFNIPVQTDKTAESIAEIRKEIASLRDTPLNAETMGQVKSFVEGSLTGGLSSLAQLNMQLLELARNDLAADAHAKALARLQTLTPADLQSAAKSLLQPGQLIWIIAGQRAAIERELKELGVPFVVHEVRPPLS